MTTPEPRDLWAIGASYEPYVGRWSRLVAHEFLLWLAVPPHAYWLDIGCGTGALSQTILEVTSPQLVRGVDASQGYIAYARKQIHDPRADFLMGDVTSLPVSSDVYDAVVSGLRFLEGRGQRLSMSGRNQKNNELRCETICEQYFLSRLMGRFTSLLVLGLSLECGNNERPELFKCSEGSFKITSEHLPLIQPVMSEASDF
jgi:methyltransferase family protein